MKLASSLGASGTFLLTSLLLLAVYVCLTFLAQAKPGSITTVDKRDVVSQLFNLELPENQQPRIILISPNVDTAWLPIIKNVEFRTLKYEDLRRVEEYYDIQLEIKRTDEVHAALLKGDYCTKAGRRYAFRRGAGGWKARRIGSVRSSAFSGACNACRLGMPSRDVGMEPGPRASQSAGIDQQASLQLQGAVRNVQCKGGSNGGVKCELDLDLQFVNRAERPIIILRPHGNYSFWHGGTALALTKADLEQGRLVYAIDAWPSVYRSAVYQELGDTLDKRVPPSDWTIVLPSNAEFRWQTQASLFFESEKHCDGRVGVAIGWKEIRELSSRLWLRLSYEMWPFNVENFKPGLGGQLKKRWRTQGDLYLQEKQGRYWFAHVSSTPIELDLRGALSTDTEGR